MITRRNVNPGNNVQVGQGSHGDPLEFDEIWVDANFKETQLRDLRIGQPVDLNVDMYRQHDRRFRGRIAGFTMGTGSTLSLCCRHRTRRATSSRSCSACRFASTSWDTTPRTVRCSSAPPVEPVVHINEPATGPDAGKFLRGAACSRQPR